MCECVDFVEKCVAQYILIHLLEQAMHQLS